METSLNTYRLLSYTRTLRETAFGKEFFNIGPTPNLEECTQAGNNPKDSILECMVYIDQLIRVYGDPPKGCEFFVMRNEHDAGTYYDVDIFYKESSDQDESDNDCENYALLVENGIEHWDEISLKELKTGNHHLHVSKVITMKKSA